jgi:DNA-binding transcriptional MocR family regulator
VRHEKLLAAGGRRAAAGLHVTVELPADDDEEAIRHEARRRRIALSTMSDHRPAPTGCRPP